MYCQHHHEQLCGDSIISPSLPKSEEDPRSCIQICNIEVWCLALYKERHLLWREAVLRLAAQCKAEGHAGSG